MFCTLYISLPESSGSVPFYMLHCIAHSRPGQVRCPRHGAPLLVTPSAGGRGHTGRTGSRLDRRPHSPPETHIINRLLYMSL